LGTRVSDGQISSDRLQLAAIVDTLTDPVFSKTLDGTIESWNAGAEDLYGYRADEVVGKSVSILVPPERESETEEIIASLRLGEMIEQFETVRRRKDGTDVHVSLSISPVRRPGGQIIGAYVVAHDISKLVRREEIQSLLAEASRLLVANASSGQILSRIAELTLSSLADWCVIETADVSGSLTQVAVAHKEPAKVELVRELRRRYPPDPARPTIPLRVLATGRAELIPEVSEALLRNIAQDAEHLRALRGLAFRSMMVVPLRVRGRAIGTMLLANAESSRGFTSKDLELAEDLARRVALAIDNAALHKSEQEARRKAERSAERIGRLQAATAALSGALTPAAVAQVLVGEGAAAVGASGGFVRLLTPDGGHLKLVAALGISKSFVHTYRNLPLTSPLLGAEVFRTGVERYFESAAAVQKTSPELAREHEATGHEAIAFVPLRVRGRPIGVIALSFAKPRTFDEEDRELLRALAGQCAQALERARLYEAERQARAAAELAIKHTMHLQSLAAELAEALTPAQVAEVIVAQGVASAGADAGAIQLLSDDGKTLEAVSAQGSNPDLTGVGWRRIPIDLKLPSTDAVRRREPVFIESPRDIRDNYPLMPTRQPALRARAGAHIPLIASGQVLGVLFLGFSGPRKFSKSQRSFVLALGHQGAQALSRAQLYETALEARSRLSRLVERLQDGVVSFDRRGRVVFANSTARRMLPPAQLEEGGRVPEDWLGFPLRRFVADLFSAGEGAVEAQVVSQDGDRVFDVTGIRAVRAEAALVVLSDVSDRERRRRVEREFVANAAHELRTPLAAITSSVERLQAGAREIPEKRDLYVGHIQHESSRLNRLASSLLVLARAQSREEKPRCEEITLRTFFEGLVSEIELSPEVELVLDCPSELLAHSNHDLLEHALLNLVGNAARHTNRGRICIKARVDDDGVVTIDVSDTGSGIPPEELSRLFDRFYRGPGEVGSTGFGLGLPIVKEAVQAIGGRVEIESVVGVGTTARIVLPATDTAALA
jgi:PAS domain S-box-containing protein